MGRTVVRWLAAGALSALLGFQVVASSQPPVPSFAQGPFTIKGQIRGLDGRPVGPGVPVSLFPMLPNPGMDLYNLYYQIPGYQDHLTFTDAEGKFEMRGVVLHPEVKHRIYVLWASQNRHGEWVERYPFLAACTRLDLGNQLSNEVWVDLTAEPAGAVKIVAQRPDGSPFTGTRAVSIASGFFKATYTAEFRNGVYVRSGVLASDKDYPWTRVVIMNDPNGAIPTQRALDAGKPIDLSRVVDDGPVVCDIMTVVKPEEFTVLRVTVP